MEGVYRFLNPSTTPIFSNRLCLVCTLISYQCHISDIGHLRWTGFNETVHIFVLDLSLIWQYLLHIEFWPSWTKYCLAQTLLGTVKLLYRCTLFQTLYTWAYLQLLSRGLESKVLPVKRWKIIVTNRQTERVKYGGSTLPKNCHSLTTTLT